MRGVLALARGRYVRRLGELEAEGTTGEAADAIVLAEARAAGGEPREGETINLSMWSERLAMPRDVLEALALAITREQSAPAPSAPPLAPASPPREASLPAMTPPPVATRNPPVGAPASFRGDVFELRFRFPDAATLSRCLAPVFLASLDFAGPRSLRLGDVEASARIDGLECVIRLDTTDLTRAAEAARALEGLELLRFRINSAAPEPPRG